MKKKIIIIGTGFHASVIFYEILKQKKYNFLGFYDEENKKKIINNYKGKNQINLHKDSNFKIEKYKDSAIIGIGHNNIRKNCFEKFNKKNKKIKWESVISKDCRLSLNVKIGVGCFIMSGSTINNNTEIGNHCYINTNSSLDHDNKMRDFSSVGPGVVTGGNVIIGSESYIGIGSTVKNNILVSSNTIIGSGSLVIRNCVSNSLYYGLPAKKIRKISKKFNYLK